MEAALVINRVRAIGKSGLGPPILLLMLLSMMVLPLPPLLLDLFFTFNIALSLVVILVCIYIMRPLDLEIFPSLILVATLMRLALNVASTRVVLLEGHNGGDAAGKVIEAFGEFVIGGNYAVGLVVFIILVIINFVVVTKGAGRVSEVSARFTLDAMPGKQMAIDADLNAGLMTQEEAKARREEVSREADFYGAMDGASKFVRGDAIAGILILFINVIGGLGIGMAQHDLAFADALRNYTLLTIGDGLVAQIPSLLLSTAAAIIVTRANSPKDMGQQVGEQLFSDPRALYIAAGVLGLMGMIPGMPNFAFLSLAALIAAGAWWADKRRREADDDAPAGASAAGGAPGTDLAPSGQSETRELSWDDVQPVDVVGLEVGYRLIPMVDRNQGGQLMQRIKGVRKKLSQELGFLVPSVHIRDNLDLAPNAYRITLMGVPVGDAEIHPDRSLAINPGRVYGSLAGIETEDPAFGLEAVWVENAQKDHAQTLGYTVVDPGTVVATHLSQVLQSNAQDLIGHEEVQQLLDGLSKISPKLVEDLVPKVLSVGQILKVLQNLLSEGIAIRDIRTIAETLAEHGPKSQDPATLTAAVRVALGRQIVQQLGVAGEELSVMTLDPGLEQLLLQALQTAGEDGAGIEPGLAEGMHQSLMEQAAAQEAAGNIATLLVSGPVRPWLAKFVRHSIPTLKVLAYNEIPDQQRIKVVATVGGGNPAQLG